MEESEQSAYDKKRSVKFPPISEDLAELVGIHIGDGCLGGRTNRKEFLFQVSGHSLKDRYYCEKNVIPLIESLFGIEPKIRFKKSERTLEIRVFSKGVFNFLRATFDLPVGKK